MEGSCFGKISKYFLFLTNFLVFALGIAVMGCGIWVLVDQPSFMDILDKAADLCSDDNQADCDDVVSNISLYSSAAYIIIVIAVLAVLISFFGCCGAMKENKCMLGTYFTIILALFIVMLVGAILAYSGDFEEKIKTPMKNALKKYNDQPDADDESAKTYKDAWNKVQSDLKCCGIDSFTDWQDNETNFNFPNNYNKPEGCCESQRDGGEVNVAACRAANPSGENAGKTYYFKGCYTAFKDEVAENQELVVGIAIAVVVVMFLNILFSFSLCMMVKS